MDSAWSFVETLGCDLATQGAYPFRLAKHEPVTFAIGAAGFATLVITDPITHDWIHSPVEGTDFQKNAQSYCDIVTAKNAAIMVAGFGLVGIAADSRRERDTAVLLTRALITTTAWTGALKYLTGRERPRETSEYHSDWTGPSRIFAEPDNDRKNESFPSGHSSNAWTMATVLAHQYPAHRIVPALAYTGAAAMSYARVVVNAHWVSDVVVGGLIGYGCARQVISSHDARRAGVSTTGWRLDVGVTGGQTEVGLSCRF